MREIRTQIDINADPAKVWAVLVDFENWMNWNPTVTGVAGEASLNSQLTITMPGPNGKGDHAYKPTITEFKAPHSFRWRAKMMAGFLMTNDRIIHLETTDSGTRLTNSEAFSGLLVSLFWNKLNQGVPSILEKMNEALKTQAESK